ncbi:MAG: hypothetical protein KKG59_00290 [Nanoarchaeota archaeon]|nr:hypothetical protein [Nanoarchaeota archaeon]
MKKAQGISINVIIIAAIALLVLVILAVLVLKGGTNVNEETNSCIAKGGKCTDGWCENDGDQIFGATGCDDSMVCCKLFSLGGEE